jgi:hypothetical protein
MFEKIMEVCVLIFLCMALAGVVYCGLLMIRNELAYKQFIRLSDAVYSYINECILQEIQPVVQFSDFANYDDIASRVWDWSDRDILPPEKYEIIKPFIKQ